MCSRFDPHSILCRYRPRRGPRRTAAVALVIVLAFIVLLSGVIIAFFSHSANQLQLSSSSVNQVKVDLLGQGALDTIIGDLKQEIAAGSISPAPTPAAGVTLYVPKLAINAVPARDPALAGVTGYENLIKRSSAAQPYTNSASNQAAGPSTLTPALNGQYISPSRWNYPLLLQKDPAFSTNAANFTPTGATATTWTYAPDWVVVKKTEDLSNPTTQWNASLTAKGSNPVVGRYAYAIYDEGGLLDVNAAGYSSVFNNPGFPALTSLTQSKGSLAFADLRQLPGISGLPASPASSTNLTQDKLLDNLVGFRNYASAAYNPTTKVTTPIGGNFPAFTWAAANGTNYYNFLQSATNGFLTAANVPMVTVSKSVTDHPYLTRQEFMRITLQYITTTDTDRAKLEDVFQYLGTFSRDLNQPSFVPDVNRPKIVSGSGGNDAAGGDDAINPSFLSIRVNKVFTRNDLSTQSVVGEPLVNKRFPLNYLAWLTYEGPSTNASAATKNALLNAGISQAIIDLGDDAHIKAYFGLKWQDLPRGGKGWQYIHGTAEPNGPIMTLSKVALAGLREPDFFELLKASISAGSVGKAFYAPDLNKFPSFTPEGYNTQRDNSLDAAIIQIGANIVDQFDSDGYPTRIGFNDNSLFGGNPQEYRGVEDLPYLYRVREGKIMTQDSVPAQYSLPMVGPLPPNFRQGTGVVLQEPEIWNPHAWSLSRADVTARPTAFQLVAISKDPNGVSTSNVQPGVQWRFQVPVPSGNTALAISPAAPVNTSLQFNVPSGRLDLFREPTLLLKPGVPAGSLLSSSSPTITSVYPASQLVTAGITDNMQYIGVPLGTVPMAFPGTIPAGGITTPPYNPTIYPATSSVGIVPAGFVYYGTVANGITYRLQYQDASGAFVTYDEKYAEIPVGSSYDTPNYTQLPPKYDRNLTFNKNSASAGADNIMGSEMSVVSFDPRTSRFGMIYAGPGGPRGIRASLFPVMRGTTTANNWTVGWAGANAANQFAMMTCRPDEYQGLLLSTWDGIANGNGRNSGPTAAGWGPGGSVGNATDGPGTRAVLRPGLFSQNTPAAGTTASTQRYTGDIETAPADPTQIFADPDNVVRGAMGAFVPSNATVPATAPSGGAWGLPMRIANAYSAAADANGRFTAPNSEMANRPIIINRPFRSVAELGNVFSGTPWRNLDMSTSEGGGATLLDVFTINATDDARGLVAGKVSLNTRQMPVVKAIVAGAYKDDFAPSTSNLTPTEADAISSALVKRTTSSAAGQGPLTNVRELAGKWNASVATGSFIDGSKSFVGFSSDSVNNSDDLSSTLTNDNDKRIQRFREASIRALASNSQTRVWNLMIDLVAQSGRYPQNATGFDKFAVEGEQRYWLHLAIDRYTGEVLDRQLEIVKE